MTKPKNANSNFTLHATSELGPQRKTISASKVPLSSQPLIAHNALFLVIFMCLAEKNVLTFSQAARFLEEFTDEMPDLPDGARSWLTQIINTLWNLDKNTMSGRYNIH